MSLSALAPLLLAVAVPVALTYGVSCLSRWLNGRRDPIDTLIARNRFRAVAGMERQDRFKTDRAGELRWQETLRAQRKARRPLPRTKADPMTTLPQEHDTAWRPSLPERFH